MCHNLKSQDYNLNSIQTIFSFWVSGNSIVMDVDNIAMVLLFNNLRLATQRSTICRVRVYARYDAGNVSMLAHILCRIIMNVIGCSIPAKRSDKSQF